MQPRPRRTAQLHVLSSRRRAFTSFKITESSPANDMRMYSARRSIAKAATSAPRQTYTSLALRATACPCKPLKQPGTRSLAAYSRDANHHIRNRDNARCGDPPHAPLNASPRLGGTLARHGPKAATALTGGPNTDRATDRGGGDNDTSLRAREICLLVRACRRSRTPFGELICNRCNATDSRRCRYRRMDGGHVVGSTTGTCRRWRTPHNRKHSGAARQIKSKRGMITCDDRMTPLENTQF